MLKETKWIWIMKFNELKNIKAGLMAVLIFVLCNAATARDTPHIGPAVKPPSSMTEYCTGYDHDAYTDFIPTDESEYDYYQHAMVWKHLVNSGLGFDMPSWSFPLGVSQGDEAILDQLEAGGVFYDQSTGATVDPSGQWNEVVINDPATAAIFAAISIWAWSTPVYFNFQNVPTTNPQGLSSMLAVTHCVTLSVENSTTPPHIACGWDAASAEDMAIQAMNCPGLIIENVSMSYFTDYIFSGVGSYYTEADPSYPPIDGALFEVHYTDININADRYVVIDPPALDTDTPLNDLQNILEVSEILAANAKLRTAVSDQH